MNYMLANAEDIIVGSLTVASTSHSLLVGGSNFVAPNSITFLCILYTNLMPYTIKKLPY
jgi:hypothetical protein